MNPEISGATLTPRFEQALVYAAQLHARQRRKSSGVPYLAHLLSVSALVIESGGDEDQAIAALLHDAIEDQGGDATRQEIRRRFGTKVAAIVDGCSDAETIPKPPWQGRKERFLESLRHAPAEVLRVVAADRLHNVLALERAYRLQGEAVWAPFKGKKEGTLWYLRETTDLLIETYPTPLVEELERVVVRLEELARPAGPQQR